MKTIKFLSVIFFISFAIVACSKSDDDGGDDPQGGDGNFTAKVDGNSFKGISGTVKALITNNGVGESLALSGGTNKSENLQMIIQGFDGVGTYQLNFTSLGTYAYLPDPNNPDPTTVVTYTTANGTSNNGEVKVSSFDGDTVKGTFTYTAFNIEDTNDTVSVTNGEFNIKVSDQ